MLFISPHAQYQLLGIIQEQDVYHPANGKYLRTEPAVNAEFFHGGAPSYALEQALANPRFQSAWQALPDGAIYSAYVSSFDTDFQAEQQGWSEETKTFVEEFMLQHPDYGHRYALVVPPADLLEKPWPSYDDQHHKQIRVVAREGGYDIAKIIDYERKHKNRPTVIEDLEALLVGHPSEDESEVVAA